MNPAELTFVEKLTKRDYQRNNCAMRNNFDIGDIEAFVAVAQSLSYRAAAEALNLSPSALSRRVQKLESMLDQPLLERTTRDVKLTLAGKQFFARAQEILVNVDELLLAVKGDTVRQAPEVTIAATTSLSRTFLPVAIRRFSALYPNTPVRITNIGTNDLIETVKRGDADFGISYMGMQEPSLELVPMAQDDVVLAVRDDHPFANRKSISWDDIGSERFISVWKGAAIRILLDFELAKANKSVSFFYEVRNMDTAIRFVEAGLGIAAVTRMVIPRRERSNIVGVPLVDPSLSRYLSLIRLGNKVMRPRARDFWDLLQEHWLEIVGTDWTKL